MTKTSKAVPSKSEEVTPTGKPSSKSKPSDSQIQEAEEKRPTLAYLTANEGLCLTALLLYPTDAKAMKSLKWSNTKFYKYKKRVIHLKETFAQEAMQDTMFALSLAGRHAVSTYIELMSEKNKAFRKEVADEVMDRIGVRKTSEDAPQPVFQNIIAQQWDKYGKEPNK